MLQSKIYIAFYLLLGIKICSFKVKQQISPLKCLNINDIINYISNLIYKFIHCMRKATHFGR